jgi:hypothetical protein
MLQTGNRPRFKAEAVNKSAVLSGVRRKHLNGDIAVDVVLVSKIDRCHSPLTENADDVVFTQLFPDQ